MNEELVARLKRPADLPLTQQEMWTERALAAAVIENLGKALTDALVRVDELVNDLAETIEQIERLTARAESAERQLADVMMSLKPE